MKSLFVKIKKYSAFPLILTMSLQSVNLLASENETNNNINTNSTSAESTEPAKAFENSEYINLPTNSSWEQFDVEDSFYEDPFQVSLFSPKHGEDSDRLISKTGNIFVYGLGAIGALAVLPQDITNWKDMGDRNLAERWVYHVKRGPVWDRDDYRLNYILHPYVGVGYYQAARKSGYRQWDSFLYSTLMSTVFWEYGLESFGEIPSIEDLFVTPIMGWVYGEWAFNTEREIMANNGALFGNQYLGYAALMVLDPVDYIGRTVNKIAGSDVIKAGTSYVRISEDDESGKKVMFEINYLFGGDDDSVQKGISGKRSNNTSYSFEDSKDPIGSGIVGFSLGMGEINFSAERGGRSEKYLQSTLGLYFTRSLSTRLSYTSTKRLQEIVEPRVTYESFSVDTQYYMNTNSDFRPYLSAGIGEEIWDEDNDTYNFQANAGLGLHYRLNSNWAIQTEVINYFTHSESRNEQQVTGKLVYRFAEGER